MKKLIVDKKNVKKDYPKYILIMRSLGAGARRLRKKIQNLFLY